MTDIFARNGVSLERLQALERVVVAGGIALVARGDANVQSLLSRQIAELEKAMGLVLLDRSAKPYVPTQSARDLAACCARFVRGVEEVATEAAGGGVQLRVGAGELVIRELLVPWIARQRKKDAISWLMRNMPSKQIQTDLAAEKLDVGISSGLTAGGTVRVRDIADYGMKLVLPEGHLPDKSGWDRLTGVRVALLDGSGGFRRFLAECERTKGISFDVGAECSSYAQAMDLAEAAGWAVFIPELWWRRRKEWAARTQALPGLDEYRHVLRLGWNDRIAQRRPEVARLVEALAGKRR